MTISAVLERAVALGASDVIITAGAPVTYHVAGLLTTEDGNAPLAPGDVDDLVYQMLTEHQKKEFETERELDLSFQVVAKSRFRVSVFRQRGTVGAVLRLVPLEIPHYRDLGLPERLMIQMAGVTNGLILVTGPTGAGKSTTVASFLEHLNTETEMPRHIITIEDPIEYIFRSRRCIFDQREVGRDTHSYVRALRSALRQMPHVIFVGEMRDRATIEVALTAAETGTLVISTLSTQSAAKTINRVIDVFAPEDQPEIRARLALSLRLVISQILVRRADMEGRIAAREIFMVDTAAANLIREGKIHQLDNVIASNLAKGMVLMDDSLVELHRQGLIQKSDVLARITEPDKRRKI